MSRINRKKIKGQSHKKLIKKSRKTLIWTLLLVGLMIASGFGIMLSGYSDSAEKRPYNGEDFKRTPTGWGYEKEGIDYVFLHHPEDLEGLELPTTVSTLLGGAKFVYVTFDPESDDIQVLEEARFRFMNFLSTNEQYAMPGVIIENNQYSLPIVDCNNATAMMPVIKISIGETTSVEQQGSCVIAKATAYELNPLIDRISYAMLGVLE